MSDRPMEMDDFLDDPGRMVRVSTTNADGTPHIVPLCFKFHRDNGTFFLSTGSDSVTVKNLKRNPYIALCIDDDEFPFRAVVVEGLAEVSEEMGTDHEGLKTVVDQFFGEGMWEKYKDAPTAQKIRVRVNVDPSKWKWWDFRRKIVGSQKIGL